MEEKQQQEPRTTRENESLTRDQCQQQQPSTGHIGKVEAPDYSRPFPLFWPEIAIPDIKEEGIEGSPQSIEGADGDKREDHESTQHDVASFPWCRYDVEEGYDEN